jgi:hypothetical protein
VLVMLNSEWASGNRAECNVRAMPSFQKLYRNESKAREIARYHVDDLAMEV